MNELLVDVGQTGTQWRVVGQGALGRIRTDIGLDGSIQILGQVAGVISTALATVSGASTVCVGVSGLDDVTTGAADGLMALLAGKDVARVIVAHDSVTSALGAIGDSDGVVLAIGTGIVAMGIGPSKAVRVDGWGSVLDDAGSAYWIGCAGIRAALRDADGRGERTSLLIRAVAEFGPVMNISGAIQRSRTRRDRGCRIARNLRWCRQRMARFGPCGGDAKRTPCGTKFTDGPDLVWKRPGQQHAASDATA